MSDARHPPSHKPPTHTMPDARHPPSRKRLAVLISGRGSNLQAIIDAVGTGRIHAAVTRVISDRADAGGLETARAANIAVSIAETDDELQALLSDIAPDAIALAGFMRILSPGIIERFSGKVLNIHPSLLPGHKGLNTHRRVLEGGDEYHGCSVHFATEELDAGPVVLQARIRVNRTDSPDTLAARVLRYEHVIYPRVLGWYCDDRLRLKDGRCVLDGRVLEKPETWDTWETKKC